MKRKAIVISCIVLFVIVGMLYAASIFQVYQGGTGHNTLTAHALLLGAGSSPISSVTLAAHQVPVGATSADPSGQTVPDCQDTGGNHLNYTQSTDAFSCGTSSSGGGGGGGGLTKICALTASSSASLNATSANCGTSVFSSTYLRYEIDGVNLVVASTALNLELSTNDGSTWDTTSGHYRWAGWAFTNSGTGPNGSTSTTLWGLAPVISSGNTFTFHLECDMFGTLSVCSGTGGGQGNITGMIYFFQYTQSGANAIQLTVPSGSITSGSLYIYGKQK